MHGTLQKRVVGAREIDRPNDPVTDQLVESCLSEIASTLWPINTAAHLAAAIGCEVRTVERYLGGQRDWSGDALAAIVSEILKRHGMRNVRVTGRK